MTPQIIWVIDDHSITTYEVQRGDIFPEKN